MATNYPSSKQTLPNPTGTDLLENADPTLDHDYQHGTINDTVEALQDKVGMDGSAVTTSHDYKLSEVTSTDKAVGKTATQTLTNKTLTSPQINFGSDATGDMSFRNGSGVTARLPIGTSGQILSSSAGGIPEWIANPSAADASTTVKGVVEIATTAQITAGTTTGETGARLVIPSDAVGAVGASKIVQFNASTQYPAADGSLITGIVPSTSTKLDCVYTDVTPPADTAENTIYTKAIAGGTLGTNNAVRLKIYFDTLTMTSNGTFTVRCKYGATTLATLVIASTTFSNAKGYLEFVLMATGATGTQEGYAHIRAMADGVSVAGLAYSALGTSTEDSTASKNLVVTTQSANVGTLSGTLTLRTAILEKIY